MITFKMHDTIYQQPDEVVEAFRDILEATNNTFFQNITYDDLEGILEYDNNLGEHFVKPFDLTQGTPEIVADLLQWLFSMLDAAANLY